jgi:molecular chaperone GrpE
MTDETQNPKEAEAAQADEAGTDAADAEAAGEANPDAQTAAAERAPAPDDEAGVLKDRLLRALAEMENTKKRAARDVKEAREYAVTGFARDMLDVADNLTRALATLDDETKAQAGPALATLLEGVELTEKRLASTLERHGVRRLDPEPGDALDPNKHQAAAQVPAEQPKGRIAHVMQPGYVIGERTLRAAMVVVSAGPPAGGDSASKGGDAAKDDAAAKGDEPPKDGGVDVSA